MAIELLGHLKSYTDWNTRKKKQDGIKNSSTRKSRKTFAQRVEKHTGEAAIAGIKLPVLDGSETLEQLLDTVYETGENLKRDPLFASMENYKHAVRKFFRYILDNGMETEEINGIINPKKMNQKKYTIIRIVDDKLEKLVAHVLISQVDQLDVLQRVDEINGLLVDLTR